MWAATRSRATPFGRRRTGGERRPRWSRTRRSGASPYRSTRVPHRHGPADRAPRWAEVLERAPRARVDRADRHHFARHGAARAPAIYVARGRHDEVGGLLLLLARRPRRRDPAFGVPQLTRLCGTKLQSVHPSNAEQPRSFDVLQGRRQCGGCRSAGVLHGRRFQRATPLAAGRRRARGVAAAQRERRLTLGDGARRARVGEKARLSHGEQGLDLVEVKPVVEWADARHRHLRGRGVRGGRGKHRAQDHRAVEPRKARKRKGAIAAAQPRQHDRAVEETAQPRRRVELLDLVLDECEAALVLKPRRHVRLEAQEAAARAPTFVVRLVIVPRHRLA